MYMNEAHGFGDVFTIQVNPEEQFDGEKYKVHIKSVPVIQEEQKELQRSIHGKQNSNLSARSNLS